MYESFHVFSSCSVQIFHESGWSHWYIGHRHKAFRWCGSFHAFSNPPFHPQVGILCHIGHRHRAFRWYGSFHVFSNPPLQQTFVRSRSRQMVFLLYGCFGALAIRLQVGIPCHIGHRHKAFRWCGSFHAFSNPSLQQTFVRSRSRQIRPVPQMVCHNGCRQGASPRCGSFHGFSHFHWTHPLELF